MDWSSLYATESDIGAYLPGTGTPEIPGGAAGYGGGAGAWDMDGSWGREAVPLEFPGFSVTVAPNGSDFDVTLTPAASPSTPLPAVHWGTLVLLTLLLVGVAIMFGRRATASS